VRIETVRGCGAEVQDDLCARFHAPTTVVHSHGSMRYRALCLPDPGRPGVALSSRSSAGSWDVQVPVSYPCSGMLAAGISRRRTKVREDRRTRRNR